MFIQRVAVRGTRRPLVLETRPGQPLDRKQLARDVRRLWSMGWFEDIRVSLSEQPQGAELWFNLVEKPRLRLRNVVFKPESHKRPVALEEGTPIDVLLAKQVARELEQQLIAEGHPAADVEPHLEWAGGHQADLKLRVTAGEKVHVGEIRFVGHPEADSHKLKKELRALRRRRMLPSIPGVWKGWHHRPLFSESKAGADVHRLRSFYIAKGHLDAEVRLHAVEFEGDRANLTIDVRPGPRYRVTRLDQEGMEDDIQPGPGGRFPVKELCRCLARSARRAEREGRLDFAIRLEAQRSEGGPRFSALDPNSEAATAGPRATFRTDREEPWVSLLARVEPGPRYTVGRIGFRGHRDLSDRTLRRPLVLAEGEPFDLARLRRSLARLNELGFLEPVGEHSVQANRSSSTREVDLIISVKETPRGRWSLSGPLGPMKLGGPLGFSLSSRLPPWAASVLELPTFLISLQFLAYSQPVLRAFSVENEARVLPLFTISRPAVPGQPWRSSWVVAPQLGWRGSTELSAINQIQTFARNKLAADAGGPPLAIPVVWRVDGKGPHATFRPAGALLCPPKKPRLAWLRATGLVALDRLPILPLL